MTTRAELCGIARFIYDKVGMVPDLGIVCGSGLGTLSEVLEDPVHVRYEDIPNFPHSTVAGHKSALVFGKLPGVNVVCTRGRFPSSESHSPATVRTHAPRAAASRPALTAARRRRSSSASASCACWAPAASW